MLTQDFGQTRFASTLSNYRTARKYGAKFNLLVADLWGFDGGEGTSAPSPGDSGNWTDYDNFLTQLISDVTSNGMTPGLTIDIWNEPDLSGTWFKPQSQFLDMWGRGFARFR